MNFVNNNMRCVIIAWHVVRIVCGTLIGHGMYNYSTNIIYIFILVIHVWLYFLPRVILYIFLIFAHLLWFGGRVLGLGTWLEFFEVGVFSWWSLGPVTLGILGLLWFKLLIYKKKNKPGKNNFASICIPRSVSEYDQGGKK